MNSIESMLEKVVPDGVPYLPLSEVFTIRNGYTPSKSNPAYWEGGDVPWLRMEDIRLNGRILSDSIQKVTQIACKSSGLFSADSLIFATTATIGEHALVTVPFLANQRFSVLSLNSDFRSKVNMKFAYYVGFLISRYCLTITNTSGFASVDMVKFKKFKFPVPPIEVQEEIVQILDTFTELEAELAAELAAELEARRKQYEYYRNQLLSFPEQDGVRWVPMGEVGTFIRGNALQKKDFVESGEPCIHYGQIYTHYNTSTSKTKSFVSPELFAKLKKAPPSSLIMTTTSENVQDVCKSLAWLGDENVAIGGHSCVYVHDLNPMYVAFYTQSRWFQDQKNSFVKGTKVKDISISDLSKVLIPIPDKSVQDSIAQKLYSFESLVSGTSESIPAEISARRQQYEYYRDKLLTFKELQTL